jgi:hypothetical protein
VSNCSRGSGVSRNAFKTVILFEAAAAILFFGSLAHQPELERCAESAIQELAARGYEMSADSESGPVRVYPAGTDGSFSASHAGGWRPGVISLRESPQGSVGAETFLRHELMHEASFRACAGKLPQWAEEAAAMDFSGELRGQAPDGQPEGGDLDRLRRRVRIGASLDSQSYRALARLVAVHGWPQRPCGVSEKIEKLLGPPGGSRVSGFSALLIHLLSGRVLESQGDLKTRYPPGSLLKMAYAAALKDAPGNTLGEELIASDTGRLLRRTASFDPDRYRFLVSVVKDSPLGRSIPPEDLALKDERFWRSLLGERAEDGDFPLEASLPELAGLLRACLLYRPDMFRGLSRNGFSEASTLYGEPEEDRRVLARLRALSKTGTVSDDRGSPLFGHLMVAWPAEAPVFLAVFRSPGVNGAANLRHASRVLDDWSIRHPTDFGKARVRLLSLTPRASWQIVDECPCFDLVDDKGWTQRVSTCGTFRILSSSRGSRSERLVAGVLKSSPDGQMVVLETDPETYADNVLSAEADDLPGEARKALRAVIVWNGTHGGGRHPDSSSVCDSTHCMVFQGSLPEKPGQRKQLTDPILLKRLDELVVRRSLDWLPFSKGGVEKWEKQVASSELQVMVNEPAVLDLRRERTRSGEVVVHLIYPENEETVPCEVFRNRLKLLSCPQVVRRDASGGGWVFQGIGEGHGQGLAVENARALAKSGSNASAILAGAYE